MLATAALTTHTLLTETALLKQPSKLKQVLQHSVAHLRLLFLFRINQQHLEDSALCPGKMNSTEVLWVGKGLCHCLEIFGRLGSSAKAGGGRRIHSQRVQVRLNNAINNRIYLDGLL